MTPDPENPNGPDNGLDPSAAEARRLLQAGVEASQRNDSLQAITYFMKAGAAAPKWAAPRFLAGSEHAALGQIDLAEAELANAVLLDPTLHIARYQLGLLQFTSGRAAMALLTWSPLVDASADPGLAEFVRGYEALAHDRLAEAAVKFQSGLTRAGVNPAVAQDVRMVLARVSGASAPASQEAGSERSAAHLLVANYGKFNLH